MSISSVAVGWVAPQPYSRTTMAPFGAAAGSALRFAYGSATRRFRRSLVHQV
jgi:hypothetical protein